jgi:hypothetical protein
MVLAAAMFLTTPGIAQAPTRLYRQYATQRVQARLLRENPETGKKLAEIERHVVEFNLKGAPKQALIPVVFHIVYVPGEAYPDEEQVYSQLAALNRDFAREDRLARHAADTLERFMSRAAKMDIEFCLPRQGPAGRGDESAIRFVPSAVREWGDDDAIKSAAKGGADPWDTERYLNVWVGQLADTLSGYAQMPGGPTSGDGIVIDYRFFGTMGTALAPYDQGKTLTHLVGSYLNLYELWNERIPCGDDYVEDTPIHNAPNYHQPGYKHLSTCHDNPVEMTMNFMDNTDDEALYMFTLGQKARMQASLAEGGPRAGLLEVKTKCDKEREERQVVGQIAGRQSDEGEEESPLAQEASLVPRLRLFPNPAGEAFTLELEGARAGRLSLVVYSTLGAVVQVLEKELDGGGLGQWRIDTGHWAAGVYLVNVRLEDFRAAERLVIIAKP